MRSGTILDFLRLVADNEDLQSDLFELASKHGFVFTNDVLDDADLERVAGGTTKDTTEASVPRETASTQFLDYLNRLSESIATGVDGTSKG